MIKRYIITITLDVDDQDTREEMRDPQTMSNEIASSLQWIAADFGLEMREEQAR